MLALALACGSEPQATPQPELVVVAADLQPQTPDGTPFDPLADREHDVVVLLFVTPDCPVSNRYAPELQRIATAIASPRIAWWLVYPDPDTSAAAIEQHKREYALPWPALRDPGHELVRRAQAIVTPEAAVFVDGALAYHGRVDDRIPELGRARPEPTVRDLQDTLTAVLAGAPPRVAVTTAVGCPIGDLR